jgi:hypothetical protein
MATIPTVPSFTFQQAPSIAVLNQLASCVTFATRLPAWAALTGSQSLTNNTVTALSWTAVTDRDGGTSGTEYIAQTPGYYELAAGVSFASNSTGVRLAYFVVTTGANNPGGSGHTTIFGTASAAASPTNVTRLSLGAVSPYLYLLDVLQVVAFQNSGGALAAGTNSWNLALIGLGP